MRRSARWSDPVARVGLLPHRQRLDGPYLDEVQRDLGVGRWSDEGVRAEAWIRRLQAELQGEARRLARLRELRSRFTTRYSRAASGRERRRHVLAFAAELGASGARLRADERAFRRWFDYDAVLERCQRRVGRSLRRSTLFVERLGRIIRFRLEGVADRAERAELLRRLEPSPLLVRLFDDGSDPRLAAAALTAARQAVLPLAAVRREAVLGSALVERAWRAAQDRRRDALVQVEALRLVEALEDAAIVALLGRRLARPSSAEDLFVRREAVEALGRLATSFPEAERELRRAAGDPSPYVRQGLTLALQGLSPGPLRELWLELVASDPAPQVRGAALAAAPRLLRRPETAGTARDGLLAALRSESDELVLGVALDVSVEGLEVLAEVDPRAVEEWRAAVLPQVEWLHAEAAAVPVRRRAGRVAARLRASASPAVCRLREGLVAVAARIPPGGRRRLPRELVAGVDDEELGAALALVAEDDFPLEVERRPWGAYLGRGFRFRFRSWRLLHELRHPAPDKRQGHRHTIGRVHYGVLRAPSERLAELSRTRVPGEPVQLVEEGGWRPFLPLVDDVLSSLNQGLPGRPIRFFTGEGVTELTPPRTPWGRLAAWARLTVAFPRYAALRDGRTASAPDDAYARELAALGFGLRLDPPRGGGSDPSVSRFFPALLPVFEIGGLAAALRDYFLSLYGNSLPELMAMTAAGATAWVGRHAWIHRSLRRWRRSIPLVIGGWGTRGKSSVERLKAALFNGLGDSVFAKTTGCEAMFLHAGEFGELREMFLFRPYDKATIWEQRDVLRLAARLESEVFLWECMGLGPSFVRILQHDWMRDDLSTLTNTYPDHEDLQGPAGIDIPQVMARFVPPRSRLITSEEEMLPVLRRAAEEEGSEMVAVGGREAGLIAPDVLERFPYQEHPRNVALVLALARELGIEEWRALREMSARVVPDLGVLKTFPAAAVRTRRLEFVNGMSANERHGCLSNWRRVGLDRQDAVEEPGVWVTTVVNNRADRVPRSRAFAAVMVEDLSVDRHFLIGGNLQGMRGYLDEAFAEWSAGIDLWPGRGAGTPDERLLELVRRFRQPASEEEVSDRLAAMVDGLAEGEEVAGLRRREDDEEAFLDELDRLGAGEERAAIAARHGENLRALAELDALRSRLAVAEEGDRERLDDELRDLLATWFERKLVFVDDPHASGERIVATIVDETPPRYRNRCMGIQNIKGTGLDFVYRWLAWERCHAACRRLADPDPEAARRGVAELARIRDYGQLSAESVERAIAAAREAPAAQRESFQAQLAVAESHLDAAVTEVRESLARGGAASGLGPRLLAAVESVLDAGDAVRRRRTADRVMADLAAERIGSARAARKLEALNRSQKGGWLGERVAAVQRSLERWGGVRRGGGDTPLTRRREASR